MKCALAPLALLAVIPAILALPEPVPAQAAPTFYIPPVLRRSMEKRTESGTVEVNCLYYRVCPREDCAIVGQYDEGTPVEIICYTRNDTTILNGDAGWAELTNGDWVPLGFGKYVTWIGGIPYCT